MKKKKLIIIGGYGSGEIAMSVFHDVNSVTNEWSIEGFLSDVKKPGERLGNHKILGPTEELPYYIEKGYYIHYTLHFNAKKKEERVEKFLEYKIPLELNATAIHPKAFVNPSTKIGYGVLMLPFASTSFGPEIGNFIHIYTNGFVGHDSIVKDFCTIAAHSVIGGRVLLEEGVHVGLNSTIREDLIIGKYAIIGMGSVIVKNINPYEVVGGNPGALIKTLK